MKMQGTSTSRLQSATFPGRTHDPDKIAERRRLLQENAARMRERWQRAEDDVAVEELAQLPPSSIH